MFTSRNVIQCNQGTGKQCADTESGPCYFSAQAGNSSVHNWNVPDVLVTGSQRHNPNFNIPFSFQVSPQVSLINCHWVCLLSLPKLLYNILIWHRTRDLGPADLARSFPDTIYGNANICSKYCRPLSSDPSQSALNYFCVWISVAFSFFSNPSSAVSLGLWVQCLGRSVCRRAPPPPPADMLCH